MLETVVSTISGYYTELAEFLGPTGMIVLTIVMIGFRIRGNLKRIRT